jgi:hypothetical protein
MQVWNGLSAATCVRFDVGDIIACADVVPSAEHVPGHGTYIPRGYALIEAKFAISAFVHYGQEDNLVQFVYVVENPNRSARMVAWAPANELVSDVSGAIRIKRQQERNNNFDLSASGQFEPFLSANAKLTDSTRQTQDFDFQAEAPKHILTASGTLSRGYGVYFKLLPSSQTSLEGSRSFSLTFCVPSEWRADWLKIACAAYSRPRTGRSTRSEPICGSNTFLVAIYRSGDEEARQAVRNLMAAERELRAASNSFIESQRKHSDSPLDSVLRSLAGKKEQSAVPHDYFDKLVFSRTVSRTWHHEYLPRDVREAVSAFIAARSHVDRLALPPNRPMIDDQASRR